MAIVFSQGIFLWADLLTDLTGSGTDDGITTDQIGWAEDQNNWYYCTAAATTTSTWTALATGGGSATAGLEGVFYNNNQFYVDANDRNSYSGSGTTWTDLIGDIAGTMTSVTITNGHFNFDGSTSNVTFTKDSDIDDIFAGGGSIVAWVRVETDGELNAGRIADTSASTTEGWSLYVEDETGTLVDLTFVANFSGTAGEWNVETPIELGQWVQVVVTYDSDSTANDPIFYVNTTVEGSSEVTTPAGSYVSDAGNDLVVGNRSDGARTFDGDIDQVMLYDRVLAADEVKQLFRVMQDRLRPNLNAPDTSVATGNSQPVTVTTADGGSTSGTSGAITLQTGVTSGSGDTTGAINLTTGAPGAASTASGSIVATLGAPGSGGTQGTFQITHSSADTAGLMVLSTTGTNGATSTIHSGIQDPSGVVSASPGALYVRVSTTSSTIFVNTGSAFGTTWTNLSPAGGVSSLVQVDLTQSTGSLAGSGGSVDIDFTSALDKGLVVSLEVTRTAGTGGDDVDIEFYTKDTYLAADRIYFAEAADASTAYIDRSGFFVEDQDATREFHVRVTNNSAAAATFDVQICAQGEGLLGSVNQLSFTDTKTALYTAASWEHVKYDPSGGTFTINMPASPATDDQVGIKNFSSDTTAITVSGNGNNIEEPSTFSLVASVTITGDGLSIIWQYDGTQWLIV